MSEKSREDVVQSIVAHYVNTRSITQIRDYFGLIELSRDIIRNLEAEFSIWRKWSLPREAFAKSVVECWIPLEDLRSFLNDMPGPELTPTDVAQRLRAFSEEGCDEPNEVLKDGCRAIYENERAQGTELAAIAGVIRDYVHKESIRLYHEQWDAQKRDAEERKAALEQQFLSGEDCKWTPVAGSADTYCRINGRAYRLSPKDGKMRSLFRITSVDDPDPRLIGKYQTQTDAGKALSQIAFQPEPRR